MSLRVLAIDPSLRRNGLCISDGTTWLLEPKGLLGLQRLSYLRDHVEEILDNYQPHVVMLENYAHGKGNRAHQIGEWGGVLRMLLRDMGRPVVLVSPAALKTFATGNHQADKEAVVAAMSEAAGRQFHKGGDEADAYALCAMPLAFIGGPRQLVHAPAERVKKLHKLPWPRVVREAMVAA